MQECQKLQSISYRPFEDSDFDAVTDICARIWCSDVEGVYDRMIFGRVMTAGALKRSQAAYVAVCEGVVVGACFGGVCKGGEVQVNDRWASRFADLMVIARKRAKIGGVRVEEMLFSKLRMYTMADVFISRKFTNSEAEVNLLVAHPKYDMKSIGDGLIERLVMYFCEEDCHGCFVVIDDGPGKDFYESHLMTCVQERKGAGGDSGGRTIWLYGRRL